MADKSCIKFWSSVAQRFGHNQYVFYELYNEPHISDESAYATGDATTAGMLEMLAQVRKHTDNPVVIAGAAAYAYDADSLVTLDAQLVAASATNILFNFHPYMGPAQAGASNKCPAGFRELVSEVVSKTDRPLIITEFGQACCPTTGGVCEHCPSSDHGYDEEILIIAQENKMSWLPWAWRPTAAGPNPKTCQDVNGGGPDGNDGLTHPTDGKGADFATLWKTYAPSTGPSPGPAPSGCPGGSLSACMGLCPASPAAAYKACVQSCVDRCT